MSNADKTAAEIIETIMTITRETAAPILAMPHGKAASPDQLRARRFAAGTAMIALRKRIVSEFAPAILARDPQELEALDVEAIDQAWRDAAGPMRDRDLSDIILG